MKRFVFLTYGFEKPTAETMDAWGKWFESIEGNVVEKGRFPRGREISRAGVSDLPLGPDSITGLVIVEAASFETRNGWRKAIRIFRASGCTK